MIKILNYATDKTILSNNDFFDSMTVYKINNDSTAKWCKIIERVEKVSFYPDSTSSIISKFTGEVLPLTKISTGCKTLMNVIMYPQKIFSIVECGENILDELYKLQDAYLYSPNMRLVFDKDLDDKEFRCYSKGNEITVKGVDGIARWYETCEEMKFTSYL